MSNIYYYLLSALSAVTLSSCNAAQNIYTAPPYPEPVKIHPTTNVPLPVADFSFLLPIPKLNTIISPRKNISETFSQREKNDIAVPDPKLMADENTIIVNLGIIDKDSYAFPLPGAKVISPYGGKRKMHSGVDLKTCPKDTILSAFDGIVRLAKPYAAYGKVIVVRHYNGLETIYSHNSKNLVKSGDCVKAGQPIALTGRTGRATTEHLHFEIRINGQHFNPNMIFDLQKRKLSKKCLIFTKQGNSIAIKSVNIMPHQLAGSYSYQPSNKESVL